MSLWIYVEYSSGANQLQKKTERVILFQKRLTSASKNNETSQAQFIMKMRLATHSKRGRGSG
jgi:hypothetical protein